MRRRIHGIFSFLVCLAVMISLWGTGSAVSLSSYDISQLQQPTAALDLVILMDNSGSMYGKYGNDSFSFRYDAAAIMLNMCESQGTQAAVYEFGNTPIAIGTEKLTSIDISGRERASLTEKLTNRVKETIKKETGGDTYLGTALKKAAEVLDAAADERSQTKRAPVILLLADGECDPNDLQNLEAAKQDCISKGYKIYSVLLKGRGKFNTETLTELSEATGGRAFELNDAAELPKMFAQVFADQTGAELTYNTKYPEELEDGTWEVGFSIPNTAVSECNIMIPTDGLEDIQLFRPGSEEPILNSDISDNIEHFTCGLTITKYREVARGEKPRFELFKIMAPVVKDRDLGTWHLRFKADQPEAAKSVSITVVFNYNLKLKAFDAEEKSEFTCNKGDRFDLTAKFFMPNNQPSKDDTLYKGRTGGEEETGISCTAYLFSGDETEYKITEFTPFLELVPNPDGCRFEKNNISIADFGLDMESFVSGDYIILVKAQGDGLIRAAEPVRIHVNNQEPAILKEHEGIKLVIQNPANLEKPDSDTVNINEYLADPDGNSDIKDIILNKPDDASSIVSSNLNKADKTNANLTVTTAGIEGTETLRITMVDYENAEKTLEIPVSVKSALEKLKAGYSAKITPTPPAKNPNGSTYEKGETVTLTVSYERKPEADGDFLLEDYKPSIDLYRIGTGADEPELLQGGMASGDTRAVTLEGENEGVYKYRAVLRAYDEEINVLDDYTLSTQNLPPVAAPDAEWSRDNAEINCDKIPDKWLGYQNTEPWTLNFSEMFDDPNGDHMSFTYRTEPEQQEIAGIDEIKAENGELTGLTITPKAEGTLKIWIKATDDYSETNPGVSEEQPYSARVTDRHAITVRYMLMILAGIAAAVILLEIIWAIIRPKFRNVSLEVSVNGAPQKEYTLTEKIRKSPMSKYVPSGFSFTAAKGAAMVIKPSREGAVILVKKPALLNGVNLTINGKPVGKSRKIQLRKNNAELKAVCSGETMSWKLKGTAGPRPGAGARTQAGRPGAKKGVTPAKTSGRPTSPGYYS